MGYDVFLSHSHADKLYADAICHRLEAADLRCWVAPRDIRAGEDWAEAIINGMDQCRVLVLVFSANSNNSPQVRREVERAVNKGLSILPIRIEDVPLSKSLEYFISAQHWLDAIGGDMDASLARLGECIAVLLDRAPPAQPQARPAAPAPQAPVAAPAPAGEAIPEHLREPLVLALAHFLGPIARHLVKRTATPGRALRDVVAALALEIDDERERKQFLARCAALP